MAASRPTKKTKFVTVYHPKLKKTSQIAESSLKHFEKVGWERADKGAPKEGGASRAVKTSRGSRKASAQTEQKKNTAPDSGGESSATSEGETS